MSLLPTNHDDATGEFLSLLGTSASIDSIGDDDENSSSRDIRARTRLDLLLGLSKDNESAAARDESSGSSFPSLCIFSSPPPRSSSPTAGQPHHVQDAASAEQIASTSLSCPTHCARSDISSVPERMARSVASTYASLISANLRQVVRNLSVRRSDLRPIRITNVTTSFVVSDDVNTDETSTTSHQESSNIVVKNIQIKIDFDVMIDANATATFSAEGVGVATCYFGPEGSSLIDKTELSIDGPRLLYSLRKQARVAALFALMAAASANGGSIGGNSIENDARGHAAEQDEVANRDNNNVRPEAAAAAVVPPPRCVSPEPVEPDHPSLRGSSSTLQATTMQCDHDDTCSNNSKRRRLHL